MEEKIFNTFKEANDYARELVKSGAKGVRTHQHSGKFQVVGSLPPSIVPQEKTNAPAVQDATEDKPRLCIDCQKKIPEARLAISPNAVRCVSCQSAFEKNHDTRPKIDEGLAGTREENKRMRGQVWGEMRGRNRGG